MSGDDGAVRVGMVCSQGQGRLMLEKRSVDSKGLVQERRAVLGCDFLRSPFLRCMFGSASSGERAGRSLYRNHLTQLTQ